jgi:polyisoprenoid-binding protein YceI
MSQQLATRVVEGLETPGVGTWRFDHAHTIIGAVARHMMVTKVRGRFTQFDGTIHIADRPEDSWVEVVIQAASIDTGVAQRDDHLRSPDFMDVEEFPQITFRSTSVDLTGGPEFRVTGDFTIRGTTRPVVLDAEYLGVVRDHTGGVRAGFSAKAELDREDFGMTWNMALEAGGVLVGKKLQIEIEVEAILQAA